jgi:hypothetical protein
MVGRWKDGREGKKGCLPTSPNAECHPTQYSVGSRMVVAGRTPLSDVASVITHTRMPEGRMYADRIRAPVSIAWSFASPSSGSTSPQSPAKCRWSRSSRATWASASARIAAGVARFCRDSKSDLGRSIIESLQRACSRIGSELSVLPQTRCGFLRPQLTKKASVG